MRSKFTDFTDTAKGFARRYICDDVEGLHLVVFYRGEFSIYGLVCGMAVIGTGSGISFDIFEDIEHDTEYIYLQYNNALVRFSASHFEDVSIMSL